VHGVDSASGLLASLEGNVAFVEQGVVFVDAPLHMSRLNFAEFSKHLSQLVVVSAGWETLYEQVEEVTLLALALVSPLVSQHLDGLVIERDLARLFDRGVRRVFVLKLNVAEASALAIGVELKLARADGPKGDEGVIELLLSDR